MAKNKSQAANGFLKEEDKALAAELLAQHEAIFVSERGDIFTNESYARHSGKPYETLGRESPSEDGGEQARAGGGDDKTIDSQQQG